MAVVTPAPRFAELVELAKSNRLARVRREIGNIELGESSTRKSGTRYRRLAAINAREKMRPRSEFRIVRVKFAGWPTGVQKYCDLIKSCLDSTLWRKFSVGVVDGGSVSVNGSRFDHELNFKVSDDIHIGDSELERIFRSNLLSGFEILSLSFD
jgi:hypothetical protein